jgi:antitoxin component of MazEF toxin-antitoxin module
VELAIKNMKDELVFKSRISKMGNNRIIWIPLAFHEMIKEFEDEDIIVSVKKTKPK